MRNVAKLLLPIMAVSALLSPVTIVQAAAQTTSAGVSTGGVSVDLLTESGIPDGATLRPGEIKDYKIAVQNNAVLSYIRVKVSFEGVKADDDVILSSVADGWVHRGDFWYYTKPIANGEKVTFVKQIKIPDVDNLDSATKFKISSYAQAVQAAHNTPDFDSEKPWGDIVVEYAKDAGVSAASSGFAIVAGNDVRLSHNQIFENCDALLPGDTVTDSITIESNKDNELYISADSVAAIEGAGDKIWLIIKNEDAVIYDGAVCDIKDRLENGVDIGHTNSDGDMELNFELILDKSLSNATSWSSMRLTLAVEARRPVQASNPTDGAKEAEDTPANEIALYIQNIATGDTGHMAIFGIASIVAVMAAGIIGIARIRRR